MIVTILLIVIIVQLQIIYFKLPSLPSRDYVAEAMERDRIAKERRLAEQADQ